MMDAGEWIPMLAIQGGIMRRMLVVAASVVVSACTIGAHGSEAGTEIDLTSLSQLGSTYTAEESAADAPFADIAYGSGSSSNRFYLSGIMGTSFARGTAGGENQVLSIPGFDISIGQTGASDQTLFTGGGALGMAIDRPMGQLRMEVEGRWRDPMYGTSTGFVALNGTPLVGIPLDFRLGTGWSAMTNFWRDLDINDKFSVYGGGGFGAGGYEYQTTSPSILGIATINGQNSVTTFAWQVGVGAVYRLNDRIEFDAGYRFFAMADADVPIAANAAVGPIAVSLPLGNFSSAFSASELLFSVRIYEPFRNWR
jgi:opacity protein-like surface antigen